MKKICVEDAIGTVLGHDLTGIIPGKLKGPIFKKGHIIREEDIEVLKSIGKNRINVIELPENFLHENDAGLRIAKAVSGEGVYITEPSEGKVNFMAKERGILKINLEALEAINSIGKLTLVTRHNNILVEKNEVLGATRAIPLIIESEKIEEVERICNRLGKVIDISIMKSLKVGIIITGTEVYEGRIKDKFAPVLKEKLKNYEAKLLSVKYAPDDRKKIENEIIELINEGAEIVLATGGMSVDADDVTPLAIENVSDRVISYGVPAMPGNMLMLAYRGNVAILGIPGAGMYYKITSLDLLLPRILSGEIIERKHIVSLGHGGYCLFCENCVYPNCSFGK